MEPPFAPVETSGHSWLPGSNTRIDLDREALETDLFPGRPGSVIYRYVDVFSDIDPDSLEFLLHY